MSVGMPAMSERQLLDAVVELARLRGWRVYHTHDARHSAAGFPDLVCVRRRRLVFAELKGEHGRTTIEQDAWLDELALVDGVEVYRWRPDDWQTGAIDTVLR